MSSARSTSATASLPHAPRSSDGSGRSMPWGSFARRSSGGGIAAPLRLRRKEIALADIEAVMAQQRVGRGAVEIEMHDGDVDEVVGRLHRARRGADRERHFGVVAAGELLGL